MPYQIDRSYAWNYQHAPDPPENIELQPLSGNWPLGHRQLPGPLGIAAGPLLNGRWILHYAALGFDWLTYKTVRTVAHPCYELPNLIHVPDEPLHSAFDTINAAKSLTRSWAVSFGMPSKAPNDWREDVRWTRDRLLPSQALSVSVVATVKPDWSIDQTADDYAQAARWAVESGADAIELNLSCPNVSTPDGQLYQHPGDVAIVLSRTRSAIGDTPLYGKIGYVPDTDKITALIQAAEGVATGLIMVNGLSEHVRMNGDEHAFEGQPRGIAGDAIRHASLQQVRQFRTAIQQQKSRLQLVGVGGIFSADHVRSYLDAGASLVQLATAVMLDAEVGKRIRREW